LIKAINLEDRVTKSFECTSARCHDMWHQHQAEAAQA